MRPQPFIIDPGVVVGVTMTLLVLGVMVLILIITLRRVARETDRARATLKKVESDIEAAKTRRTEVMKDVQVQVAVLLNAARALERLTK